MSLSIAFIHPDLGIGGAEQLVINLALALKDKGHRVKIYTPHHDRNHCFPETKDGTLDVEVRGNIIPPRILGKGTALFASLRMILCTLYVLFRRYDVIIVDQVTLCLPLIRLSGKRTIFYCHFPDKLLCVERGSFLKRIYRYVLDTLEELCLFAANMVLVNSEFTASVVKNSFPLYTKYSKQSPKVLYPTVDFRKFQSNELKLKRQDSRLTKGSFFLSLNRFERKKNIELAIKAFAKFLQNMKETSKVDYSNIRLILAGGYEERIIENRDYFDELTQLAHTEHVGEYVSFKRNITDEERLFLLQNSICVLYTPENEHFGIVPVEAMYNKAPIIACNSGGPKESISNGKTGYLCESEVNVWADRMTQLCSDDKLCQELGENGYNRVIELFGFQAFSDQIDNYVKMVVLRKLKL